MLSELKPVGSISKNKQSFLEGRQPLTDKLPESIESSRFVSHRARMSGEGGHESVHAGSMRGLKWCS